MPSTWKGKGKATVATDLAVGKGEASRSPPPKEPIKLSWDDHWDFSPLPWVGKTIRAIDDQYAFICTEQRKKQNLPRMSRLEGLSNSDVRVESETKMQPTVRERIEHLPLQRCDQVDKWGTRENRVTQINLRILDWASAALSDELRRHYDRRLLEVKADLQCIVRRFDHDDREAASIPFVRKRAQLEWERAAALDRLTPAEKAKMDQDWHRLHRQGGGNEYEPHKYPR